MFVSLNLLALFITNIFSLNDNSLHIITQVFLLLSSLSSFNKMRWFNKDVLDLTFHKRLLIMLFTFPPSFIISFYNSIDPQIISSRSIFKVYQLVVNKFWIYLGIIDFINLYINTFIFFSKLSIFSLSSFSVNLRLALKSFVSFFNSLISS